MLFSKKHVWIIKEGDEATLGLTEYVLKLGNVLFANLPNVGDQLKINESFGNIETVKKVFELISPADGEVIEVNEELLDDPNGIGNNPFESWLVKVKINGLDSELMDNTAYYKLKG